MFSFFSAVGVLYPTHLFPFHILALLANVPLDRSHTFDFPYFSGTSISLCLVLTIYINVAICRMVACNNTSVFVITYLAVELLFRR